MPFNRKLLSDPDKKWKDQKIKITHYQNFQCSNMLKFVRKNENITATKIQTAKMSNI